jgi:hypothetical protein
VGGIIDTKTFNATGILIVAVIVVGFFVVRAFMGGGKFGRRRRK